MKLKNPTTFVPLLTLVGAFSALPARGAHLYVDINSTNPVVPYTNQATAATIIQDAVDAATNGDVVVVYPGIYTNGFGACAPLAGNSNRVAIGKPITVQSAYGAASTVIVGAGPAYYDGVRCAYLTNGASLKGFTLRGGASFHFSTYVGGGGAFLDRGGVLEDCIVQDCESSMGGGVFLSRGGEVTGGTIVSNRAYYGAGAYLFQDGPRVVNSTLGWNAGAAGGGAYADHSGMLESCTIVSNRATGSGGGAYLSAGGAVVGCSILGNSSGQFGGGVICDAGGLVSRCRILRNTAEESGAGYGGGVELYAGGAAQSSLIVSNIAKYHGGGVELRYGGTLDDCTVFGNYTYTPSSGYGGGGVGCVWWGDKLVRNCIIYGNRSLEGPPNWSTNGSTGTAAFQYCCTSPTNGLPDGQGCFESDPLLLNPDAGDFRLQTNSPCVNAGTNLDWMLGAVDLAGRSRIGAGTVDLGAYEWSAGIHYVWTNSPAPAAPYESWKAAAHTIQDAITAAIDGDTVLATNGVYDRGGTVSSDGMTNRIAITNAIQVQSVNGWRDTVIVGQGVGPGGTNNGEGAIRCAYLGRNTVLAGFTLTNGHTANVDEGTNAAAWFGGGALGYAGHSLIHDCLFIGNSAGHGGGAANSILSNCTVTGNSAVSGGGAYLALSVSCLVSSNRASANGGGTFWAPLINTLLVGNSASKGGGADSGRLEFCTVLGNVAESGGGLVGDIVAQNCIAYFNTATSHPESGNYQDSPGMTWSNCCTVPRPAGSDNITNEPAFVNTAAGDFRLRYGSPCIDAGSTPTLVAWPFDLAGTPRLLDGNFDGVAQYDIGAYEYNPASYDTDGDGMADGWEHSYGLNPTNAADAVQNPDGDPHNNLQEYFADTNPTNALSYLRIVALSNVPPWTVWFEASSTNRRYTLEFNTYLAERSWTNVPGQLEVPGTGGIQTLYDTDSDLLRFYRVGVRP